MLKSSPLSTKPTRKSSRPTPIDFIVDLHRTFNPRRKELLQARHERQKRLDAGEKPNFLPETRSIRESEWTVAPLPADLLDRRVEITGPVDRKMIINALNSGAKVFMADFEDSSTPTWNNLIDGHINLRDAIRRAITYADPASGSSTSSTTKVAVLFVRPRGWHLDERHVHRRRRAHVRFPLRFRARTSSTMRKELLARGSGPYFYLPKMESHLEARLWNDVFIRAQKEIGAAARHDQGPRC